jgi:hypothetical protein
MKGHIEDMQSPETFEWNLPTTVQDFEIFRRGLRPICISNQSSLNLSLRLARNSRCIPALSPCDDRLFCTELSAAMDVRASVRFIIVVAHFLALEHSCKTVVRWKRTGTYIEGAYCNSQYIYDTGKDQAYPRNKYPISPLVRYMENPLYRYTRPKIHI